MTPSVQIARLGVEIRPECALHHQNLAEALCSYMAKSSISIIEKKKVYPEVVASFRKSLELEGKPTWPDPRYQTHQICVYRLHHEG